MPELELNRVTLSFGGLTVLNAVSLSVQPRELLALIGPNGAGKTSIFNCISGIYRPQGDILFRGQSIVGRPPHAIAQLGIARTFQHGELFQHMTVAENLMTARHPRMRSNPLGEVLRTGAVRREEAAHRAAVDDVIRLIDLQAYRDTPVATLPFGRQKIVGFARAIAAGPSLLLLDEPSAGLTREEREDLAHFILKIKADLGIAIIWIEHDMQMVADLADRIHVLDYGRSIADGRPDDVLRDREVIQAYLGTATTTTDSHII